MPHRDTAVLVVTSNWGRRSVLALSSGCDGVPMGSDLFARPESWRVLPGERLFAFLKPLLKLRPWRSLPEKGRRSLASKIFRALAPKPTDAPPGHPITVVGFLSANSGIGEGARLTAESLSLIGRDVRLVDVSNLFAAARPLPTGTRERWLERGPGTILLHFNPQRLSLFLALIGAAHLAGKRVIGYWAWELSRIPQSWIDSLCYVDEVWVPSTFVAAAVRPFTTKPIRVVPHPVATTPPGVANKQAFGISNNQFTALCMFSFSSCADRKNPFAAVQAFRRAFDNADNARLILKLSDAHLFPASAARLRKEIEGAANIEIREANLDRQSVRNLIASVDVVLSLHRSEGFGLVMAEAMHAGTAVIATQWSGNMDFMDTESALLVSAGMVPAIDSDGFYAQSDQLWAAPDIEDAVARLRFAAANPAALRAIAQRGKLRVESELGLQSFRSAVDSALSPANSA